MKNILVLPISGGSFHVQLFLLMELMKAKYDKPDIIMGTSGGAMNSYITLYSQWKRKYIVEILKLMNSSVYCKGWLPGFLGYLMSYFKGSVYNHSNGLYNIFKTMFDNSNISSTEIWTLKVNFTNLKGTLSCNKDKSLLKFDSYKYKENHVENIKFNNGDINEIYNDCIASCSIPLIMPKVNGFIDGGMLYASPVSPLYNQIKNTFKRFHIVYVSCFDMEDENLSNTYGNLLENLNVIGENIMWGPNLLDRNNTIRLVANNPHFEKGTCSTNTLININNLKNKYKRSLLEIYPSEYINLNITNFTYDNIKSDYIRYKSINFMYRLWYK